MCVCAFQCGCMVQWLVQSISNRNIAGSIPAECGYTRLSSPSLSLGGEGKMCMSEYAWWTKKIAGQKQPLGAVSCKTRLFNSGGQFDQLAT